MSEELEDQMPVGDDVEFGDVQEMKFQGISDERWERVKRDIDIRDVVYTLFSKRGNPISCPFHGRDSKPSFKFYLGNNDALCFGCPEGDNYWDNVKIVSREMEITKPQALRWLEREFNLPVLPDTPGEPTDIDIEDEDEDGPEEELELQDLRPEYMRLSSKLITARRNNPDTVSLALELIEHYFTAIHINEPLKLAKVLNQMFEPGVLKTLIHQKFLATKAGHGQKKPASNPASS